MFNKRLINVIILLVALTAGAGTILAVKADTNGSCNGNYNTYYYDADSDGYGDASTTVLACSMPEGYVTNGEDCDDTNTTVYPTAEELCDGLDNNCDDLIDEGLATSTYYQDADSDSYGQTASTTMACALPSGYASEGDDCDDTNAEINPGAVEICDGLDNNCDGQIDEGLATSTYYQDADSDGYGSPANSQVACQAPEDYVANNNDCDDTNANIHPGATELCDGIDNDCDGQVDESCEADNTYYQDADNDGYGDPDISVQASTTPIGYVTDNTDCDDTDVDINPGALEICDGIDNDCDGTVDEGCEADNTYYQDADNDNYGNPDISVKASTTPIGYVADNNDCDDTDADINPGVTEICDGLDNDCDGQIDEDGLNTYYYDADEDGYGTADNATTTCGAAPDGYVAGNNDCDDDNADINPGALEICDNIDNDCDGTVDEDCGLSTYYRDADCDSYGDPNNSIQASTLPDCYVANNDDCNDSNKNINPGATEICDGIDNDCDGTVDEGCEEDGEDWCGCCPNEQLYNWGAFISCISHCTNLLKKQGILSGWEKGQIMKLANQQKSNNMKSRINYRLDQLDVRIKARFKNKFKFNNND